MRNDPTRRALRLLALLQNGRLWRGPELSRRLDVTVRTVRRDVDRLRELGYPVDATPGTDGGYRLAAGARLPPLVFDDDEAVAVAVGLRAAAEVAISGIEDASIQALAKIEQVLPHRLRSRVSALNANVVSLRRTHEDHEAVDPDALGALAAACRDHEEVHFDYAQPDGGHIRRWVEPHQLVSAGRRWYLVAWDLGREDWRTFRLDRLGHVEPTRDHFEPRDIPGGDGAAYFAASVASLPREAEAVVFVAAPYARVADELTRVDHSVEYEEIDSCTVRIQARAVDQVVMAVLRLALRAAVRIVEPGEVAERVEVVVGRMRTA